MTDEPVPSSFSRVTDDPEATVALGRSVALLLSPGDIVLLEGELGAGKTAFVRGVAAGLGIPHGMVSSPTFVVVNVYPTGHGLLKSLIHVDAYRVRDETELDNVGWDHLFDPVTRRPRGSAATVVEWPRRLAGALPPRRECLGVRLEHVGPTSRRMTLEFPDSWRSAATGQHPAGFAENLRAISTRPPLVCPVMKVWVPPTAPTYPFANERAQNADLYRWLVPPPGEESE